MVTDQLMRMAHTHGIYTAAENFIRFSFVHINIYT